LRRLRYYVRGEKMAMSYIPTNSVEFETLTTEPAYGDVKEFDTNPNIDQDGKERATSEVWRILGFLTRDMRLGNIKHSIDDIEYLDDRATLTAALIYFRGGIFEDLAPLALAPVSTTLELSQSRGGFFRKNSRSFRSIGENYDNTGITGLGGLFGGGKKNKGSSGGF